MGKAKTILRILGMVMLGFCTFSVMAAQNDFSGTWVLNKGKTHGLPKGVKSYILVVTQNEQQLVVESQVGGGGSSESTDSVTGIVSGRGGANRGYGGEGGVAVPGTIALSMLMPHATYSLDGKEKAVQFAELNLKVKAKWAKDGEILDLSVVQDSSLSAQTPGFTIKERWTLSNGGQVLKVQRSVGTAAGSGTITLIFEKGTDGAPVPQQ